MIIWLPLTLIFMFEYSALKVFKTKSAKGEDTSAISKAEKGTEAESESDDSSASKAEKGPKAKSASDEDSIAKSGKESSDLLSKAGKADSESATKAPASAKAEKSGMSIAWTLFSVVSYFTPLH